MKKEYIKIDLLIEMLIGLLIMAILPVIFS